MDRSFSRGPARIIAGPPTDAQWSEIEEVFHLSAAPRDFADEAAKHAFAARWLGYYRRFEPQRTFMAVAEDGRVTGYLTGCANSRDAARLYRDIPYYDLFQDQFDRFPAHFHINCHPGDRGRGIGAALIDAFVEECAPAARTGVHIVTDPTARNVGFYRRQGMDVTIRRVANGRAFLFMAKSGSSLSRGA